MSYLYTKETKSSFEIEHIKPGSTRTERFIALLQLAEKEDFCEKSRLLDLQNRIVDLRFREADYRTDQNYVGETIGPDREKVHFVCPKPEDLSGLMDGLVAAHNRMDAGAVPAVIHAAAVAYGFVFLHPFEDGNGRIHRFLIHNILARRTFTPAGIIFPVSASMLKAIADYDGSLEAFSRPLMALIDYTLDGQGRMTVQNDTVNWYRFIDMTSQAEALYRFIEMPDRKIDLLIRACLQNKGRLSARKRAGQFDFLSDTEVTQLEAAIRQKGDGLFGSAFDRTN
jgi:Fic family protein